MENFEFLPWNQPFCSGIVYHDQRNAVSGWLEKLVTQETLDQEYFSDSSGVCVLADFLCGIQDRNGGETSGRICIVF